MSEKFYKPLIININNSRLLSFLLSLQFGLVVIVIALSTGLGAWRWPLLILLVGYGYFTYAIHCRRSHPKSITRLRDSENGDWFITFRDSEDWIACEIRNAWASRLIVVLNIRLYDKTANRGLVLLPDSVDKETRRRLRLRLNGFV